MWASLKQKLLRLGKVTGLEVIFLPDGQLSIYIVTAVTQKGKIIKEQEVLVKSVEELVKKIPAKSALAVCFNGKGVLVRKIAMASLSGNPVSAVLPNANPDEFYVATSEYAAFATIALCRKEVIDPLISRLLGMGFHVLQATPGFSAMGQLMPFIGRDHTGIVETNAFSLVTDSDGGIIDFTPKDIGTDDRLRLPEYGISDQYLKGSYLCAFATAVLVLTDDLENAPLIPAASVAASRKDFRYYQLFKTAGIALLSGIFLLLLINFLIYNHYFGLNKELQVKQLLSRDNQEKNKVLQQSIQQKEHFLQNTNWAKASKVSLYADRIASLTPTNTLLTSLSVNPVKTNSFGEAGLNFKNDTIQLSGTSENPVEVNQFINNLKIIPEFRQVVIKNYVYKREMETGTFLIEIITR